MKRCKERIPRPHVRAWHTLRWRLTLFVLGILVVSGILTGALQLLMAVIFKGVLLKLNPYIFLLITLGVCALIGTILAGLFGLYYLRPLKRLIAATKEVKRGNYKVSIPMEKNMESEMGSLVASFNEMVRELDGVELLRNDFINNFSHEFKTPIVSVRGFARELQREDLTPEQRREYATIIAEEADRLSRLSTSVLELSKLENQQIVSDKTVFSLDEQLRRCILLLEPQWSEKEIEMLPELEEVQVSTNEEMLAEIWSNLLSNAIKFTSRGGTVRVTLIAEEEFLRVSVSDTGIGMSEEVRSHVFEKFYQGDPSHHRTGYGIGLAVVARVVGLLGGSVTVESEVGCGSTFTVLFPRKNME